MLRIPFKKRPKIQNFDFSGIIWLSKNIFFLSMLIFLESVDVELSESVKKTQIFKV